MRRLMFVVGCSVLIQAFTPTPARAWWGWLDEMSGPKGFSGAQVDTRLWCFGAPRPNAADFAAALKADATTRTISAQIMASPPVASTGSEQQAQPPGALADRLRLLDEALGRITAKSTSLGERAGRFPGEYFTNADLLQMAVDARSIVDEIATLKVRVPEIKDSLDGVSTLWKDFSATLLKDLSVPGAVGDEAKLVALPIGVRLSLCKERDDAERRWSVDLGARFFSLQDHSVERAPKPDPSIENYADGHRMWLLTATPGVSVRPFYFRRQGNLKWADWVDVGAGAGFYRIGSAGFEPIYGSVVEARADFHVPSFLLRDQLRKSRLRALLLPEFRVGELGFVNGFDANAFGPKLKGKKGQVIDKRVDWTREYAFFFDLGPIFR